jgi:hypothetical protein
VVGSRKPDLSVNPKQQPRDREQQAVNVKNHILTLRPCPSPACSRAIAIKETTINVTPFNSASYMPEKGNIDREVLTPKIEDLDPLFCAK